MISNHIVLGLNEDHYEISFLLLNCSFGLRNICAALNLFYDNDLQKWIIPKEKIESFQECYC